MKNILILCGNGYFFEDFYGPIVEELSSECNVFLMLENSYLTRELKERVHQLCESGIIKKYYITNLYSGKILMSYLLGIAFLERLATKQNDFF